MANDKLDLDDIERAREAICDLFEVHDIYIGERDVERRILAIPKDSEVQRTNITLLRDLLTKALGDGR